MCTDGTLATCNSGLDWVVSERLGWSSPALVLSVEFTSEKASVNLEVSLPHGQATQQCKINTH